MNGELILQINEALAKSGEREKFKELIKEKLIQAGWYDQVRTEAESKYLLYFFFKTNVNNSLKERYAQGTT